MSMVSIRQSVERDIAQKTIAALLGAGFAVTVKDTLTASTDPAAILAAMMSTDEDWLIAVRDREAFGWVRFIYGNDGWDVINDYTTNLEAVMVPVSTYADSLA